MDELHSWWEVPAIAYFCHVFQAAFNLFHYEIEELESALLDVKPGEGDVILMPCATTEQLMMRLLQGCCRKKNVNTENWEDLLRNRLQANGHIISVEVPSEPFISWQLRKKVEVLFSLCELCLDSADFVDQSVESDAMRITPVGVDSENSVYWYFFGLRLYKEDPKKLKDSVKKNEAKARSKPNQKKNSKGGRFNGVHKSATNSNRARNRSRTKQVAEEMEQEPVTPSATSSGWQLVCQTKEDWESLVQSLSKSRSAKDKALAKTIEKNYLPLITKVAAEREVLMKKKLVQFMPRRTSARIDKVRQQKEQERAAAEKARLEMLAEEQRRREKEQEEKRKRDIEMRAKRAAEREKAIEERAKRARLRELRAVDSEHSDSMDSSHKKRRRHGSNSSSEESNSSSASGMSDSDDEQDGSRESTSGSSSADDDSDDSSDDSNSSGEESAEGTSGSSQSSSSDESDREAETEQKMVSLFQRTATTQSSLEQNVPVYMKTHPSQKNTIYSTPVSTQKLPGKTIPFHVSSDPVYTNPDSSQTFLIQRNLLNASSILRSPAGSGAATIHRNSGNANATVLQRNQASVTVSSSERDAATVTEEFVQRNAASVATSSVQEKLASAATCSVIRNPVVLAANSVQANAVSSAVTPVHSLNLSMNCAPVAPASINDKADLSRSIVQPAFVTIPASTGIFQQNCVVRVQQGLADVQKLRNFRQVGSVNFGKKNVPTACFTYHKTFPASPQPQLRTEPTQGVSTFGTNLKQSLSAKLNLRPAIIITHASSQGAQKQTK